MVPPESSERLTRAVCCTIGPVAGLPAVPLVLLLPCVYTGPLLHPLWDFVALELELAAYASMETGRPVRVAG